MPQWGLGNFSLPLVSRLGVEPRNLAVPDFKSVLQFAVRGFTKTQLYKSVRCVYQFRQRLIFRTLKSFADLRHTLYNLHLYSISRETRSEHWGATPTLPAPVPKNQVLRRIGIPTTFTRHSELFDNFLLLPKYTKQQFLSSCHCDRATRTPTLPYSPITRTSTQTLFLVYHGLEQSPANP